jgi:hypothetical protein
MLSNGHTTTPRLSGRIQSANIGNIRAQIDDDRVRIFMDLDEVTLVDVEVVRFLSECEDPFSRGSFTRSHSAALGRR